MRNEKKLIRWQKHLSITLKKISLSKGYISMAKIELVKHFLISAVANELSKKGVSIIFAYVPDLVRNIHSGIGDNSVETKVEQLKYCDLLILDDLGIKMSLYLV